MSKPLNILVIRLGALGDFVQSFYPFAAIREYHPKDKITLLTTAPFYELAKQSPWFDDVLIDGKPHLLNFIGIKKLKNILKGYDFVYDLQTSSRSSRYYSWAGKPQWSGIAKGASHLHTNPNRNAMHTLERQKDQLQEASIRKFPQPDLTWLTKEAYNHIIPQPFAVFVPGSSEKHPEKRWPAEFYGQIAKLCLNKGIQPVIIGGKAEEKTLTMIKAQCPQIISLIGQTTLLQLGSIMKHAMFALGNDTGPMHLAAILDCPSVVLFSSKSDPKLTSPRGRDVKIIYQENLKDLSVKRVAQALQWVQ